MTSPIGRDAELSRLRAVLGRAGSGLPSVVLVDGEAGVGKTTLLDATASEATANGWRVLRTSGLESESTLAYAGLLDLLATLQRHLAEIPPPQASALSAALGWEVAASPGERFLIGGAVMSLLAAASSDAPTLVVVDDVQWLDRESVDAIVFAGHRLKHDPVAFVLAQRRATSAAVRLDGAETLTLSGLGVDAATTLLKGVVAEPVVRSIVTQTDGNPLALLEVSRVLTPAQRAGAARLPVPIPVGTRLRERYDDELTALPDRGWRAVVLSAVHRESTAAPVLAALSADDADPDEAVAAAGAVLRLDGIDLVFRHPLLRSVALTRATDAERRAAHHDLAEVLPHGPDRVWHLAESVAGYDDALAADLMSVADDARARLGYAAAADASARAAGLTPDPALRANRLATAVEDAYLAGDADGVHRLADRVLGSSNDMTAQARVLATLGALELYTGTFLRARELLTRSAAMASGLALVRTLNELAQVCYMLDDRAGMSAAAQRAADVADRDDPEQDMLAEYVTGAALTFEGRPQDGSPHILRAVELLEGDPALRDDPRYLMEAILCARWLMDARVALPYADRRLDRAREVGALMMLALGLSLASAGLAWMGDHRRAYAMAGEAAELLELLGYGAEPGVSDETLAYEYAARGLHDDAAAALLRAQQIVARTTLDPKPPHLARAEAFCALCRGDLTTVVTVLEDQIDRNGGVGVALEPLGVAPDLVEAYLGLGRDDDARRLAQDFAAALPLEPFPPVAAAAARCTALATDDLDEAVAAYEKALALHALIPDTVERGRTLLHYGMRLRRAGRRVEAREHLSAARDLFAGQDLTLWTRWAETELAGTGHRAKRSPAGGEPLTSQETRVALLVTEGLTNREVAATLFLSPKTVEHHLGSVLRKRGLRSRTELARLMTQESSTDVATAETG